jgi:hypothetical protein
VRIHGLLCFYDEPISELVACIKGLHTAGVDHIIAVDGAYALYPDAEAASDPNQHAAIALTCRKLGMACTLHVPSEPWAGNETAKRTFLFALGWSMADEGDWFWVQDADMVVTKAPEDLKAQLAATDERTAEVELFDIVIESFNQADWPSRFHMRSLFRADKITVGPAHCLYTASDNVGLWAGTGIDNDGMAGTLDLFESVTVEHRPANRPPERQRRKGVFYAERDAQCIERGDCEKCGKPAVRLVASAWKPSKIGGPVAQWAEACEPCARKLEKVSAIRLRQMGVDPAMVRIENRNGHMPVGVNA